MFLIVKIVYLLRTVGSQKEWSAISTMKYKAYLLSKPNLYIVFMIEGAALKPLLSMFLMSSSVYLLSCRNFRTNKGSLTIISMSDQTFSCQLNLLPCSSKSSNRRSLSLDKCSISSMCMTWVQNRYSFSTPMPAKQGKCGLISIVFCHL